MTPITHCSIGKRTQTFLKPRVVLRLLVIMGISVALALGVTHLRFLTHDLEIESSKLQKTRQQLVSQKNNLVSEVEHLKSYDRLQQYAQVKLGFRDCPPECSKTVVVSAETIDRWSDLIAESELAKSRIAQPSEQLLAVVGEKVISWSSVSMAREPRDANPVDSAK